MPYKPIKQERSILAIIPSGPLTSAIADQVCHGVLHGEGPADRQDDAFGGVVDCEDVRWQVKLSLPEEIHLHEVCFRNAAVLGDAPRVQLLQRKPVNRGPTRVPAHHVGALTRPLGGSRATHRRVGKRTVHMHEQGVRHLSPTTNHRPPTFVRNPFAGWLSKRKSMVDTNKLELELELDLRSDCS